MGIQAVKECIGNLDLDSDLNFGLISSTSVGGMDRSEIYYKDIFENKESDINLLKTHDCGDVSETIAKKTSIEGFVTTISTACSSGVNAIMLGARMIEQGLLDRVIVGGVDALTDFTINGFKSLKIYDENWCRPMDDTRTGLNLGEAAGFLLLENDKSNSVSFVFMHILLNNNTLDVF